MSSTKGCEFTFHVPSKGLSRSVNTKWAKKSSMVVIPMDTMPRATLRKGKKRSKNRTMDAVSVKRMGGSIYSAESRRIVAGTAVDSKGTVSYTGYTFAHSETHATHSPALGGVSETTMIMAQNYVGGCPAGTQPGDLMNADGRVTHLWKH